MRRRKKIKRFNLRIVKNNQTDRIIMSRHMYSRDELLALAVPSHLRADLSMPKIEWEPEPCYVCEKEHGLWRISVDEEDGEPVFERWICPGHKNRELKTLEKIFSVEQGYKISVDLDMRGHDPMIIKKMKNVTRKILLDFEIKEMENELKELKKVRDLVDDE
jgi:hypothetical protein